MGGRKTKVQTSKISKYFIKISDIQRHIKHFGIEGKRHFLEEIKLRSMEKMAIERKKNLYLSHITSIDFRSSRQVGGSSKFARRFDRDAPRRNFSPQKERTALMHRQSKPRRRGLLITLLRRVCM